MTGRVWMAGLACALAAGVAATPATAATTCRSLHGTLVRSTPTSKVVSQPVKGGRRYVGCAKPDGRARVLGTKTKGEEGASTALAIVKAAGPYLLVKTSYDEGPARFSGDRRYVIDLRTGKKRALWRIDFGEGDCSELHPTGIGYPKQFVLGANGIVVGVFVGGDCTLAGTRVVAFVPGKPTQTLDQGDNGTIAATSLRLSGRTASWKHGGEAQSAKL